MICIFLLLENNKGVKGLCDNDSYWLDINTDNKLNQPFEDYQSNEIRQNQLINNSKFKF